MSSRTLIRVALVIALLGSLPATSHAQFKDVQDNGWSTLQEGYKLVALMANEKDKRTKENFRDALHKSSTSMVKMKGYIAKMGDGVADKDDKQCATRERDNIQKAWNAMAEALADVGRKYDAEKEKPEELAKIELAKIEGELKILQKKMEEYEVALSKAFKQYEERWKEIDEARAKLDAVLKPALDKMTDLQKKYAAQVDAVMAADLKLATALIERTGIEKEIKVARAKLDQTARGTDARKAAREESERIHNRFIECSARARDLFTKFENVEKECTSMLKDLEAADKVLESAGDATKLLDRFDMWNKEFPKEKMKFHSLK